MSDAMVETVVEAAHKWRAAAIDGDVDAYIQFLADDVVFLAPNLEPLVGKTAVADFVRGVFETMSFEERLDNRPPIVSGDLAYIWGTYDSVFSKRGDGSSIRELGKHVFVWRREGPAAWRLALAVWNTRPAV